MIKFLKRFKEKILIALVCSFIGIGTLLSNNLNTYAYTSDRFSYTCEYVGEIGINNYYNLYTFDSRSIRDTCLLINIDTSVLNNSIGNQQNNINIFGNIGNYNNGTYTNSISSLIYMNNGNSRNLNVYSYIFSFTSYGLQNYTCNCLQLNFQFNTSSGWINLDNSYILNIDFVSIDDVIISDYMDTYTNTLQSQYDTLQAEYTAYQNTHAYTNEQYNALITQNSTLTQQVQTLQSQYDTYVSLHLYTNEQYNQLLLNYNTLQNMYGQLQSDYLDLQQSYNALLKDLNPFDTTIWINRTASLNDIVFDVSSSGINYNSVVWFRGSYIQIDQREMENFSSFIEGDNHFHFVSESTSEIVLPNFDVIANFSHSLDYGFSVEFYLNNTIIYSSIIFNSDMTTSDGSTTNFYQYNSSLTFNKIVIDVYGGPGPSTWTDSSYLRGEPGTWQNGYDYALSQLMPQINQLENDLRQSNVQQQVKYNEGYNQGISDSNSKPLYQMVIRIL